MGELNKILSVERPSFGITELFQEKLRELINQEAFVATTQVDASATVSIAIDGEPTTVAIRVAKRSLRGSVLCTATWLRTVHYEGREESDDTRIAHHSGSSDTITETRHGFDWMPDELKAVALELVKRLDEKLLDAWKSAIRDFLDYYDVDEWERLKEDIPELDHVRARKELENLLTTDC